MAARHEIPVVCKHNNSPSRIRPDCKLGGNAVPFIVEEIERKPSNLVWALNAIFHKKIGNGETITEACRLWIAELKKY